MGTAERPPRRRNWLAWVWGIVAAVLLTVAAAWLLAVKPWASPDPVALAERWGVQLSDARVRSTVTSDTWDERVHVSVLDFPPEGTQWAGVEARGNVRPFGDCQELGHLLASLPASPVTCADLLGLDSLHLTDGDDQAWFIQSTATSMTVIDYAG